jgi:protein transport protein SEC24
LGGIIRPLSFPETDDEEEVDVIQPGAAGIVRCKRCRTYINPFVSWIENGRRWRCNICAQLNECPSAYFCHLDPATGQRRDTSQRPELCKSVVEWIAPSEYMVRPPQPPAYFFIFDVSGPAIQNGMLAIVSRAVRKCLDEMPGGDRTMIGFITYDTAVHYYLLKPGADYAQMLVVGDLNELFVPAPVDLLVNLKDSRKAVENFLDNLPSMFSGKPSPPVSCLGPALKAAFTVMKAIGGKMVVFQSVLPTLGDGALKPRGNPNLMGTPEEVSMLRPSSTWYKDTAIEFSRCQIAVDLFLFPQQFIDCSTLSELPKLTAGSMFTYLAFNAISDGPKLESQLCRTLTQPTIFEAVLRIRCTKGMKINNYYGNFFVRGTDLLALPNCNADSTFGFDIVHDEQSVNSKYVSIQSALLYTSSDGERRIRVASHILAVTNSMTELMASVDTEATISLMARQTLEMSVKTNLDSARNRIIQTCADIFRVAKEGDKRSVSGYVMPPPGQPRGAKEEELVVPKNLELLPLFTLGLLKNVAIRGGTDVHPDERIAAHMLINEMFVDSIITFIHPKLFTIHNMDSTVGTPARDFDSHHELNGLKTAGRNHVILPHSVNLSIERLSSEGIFLLDNGNDFIIWVGRASSPAMNNSLFGVNSLEVIGDLSQASNQALYFILFLSSG